ncbi:SCO family protein [Hyphococcus sp.]|uniref:SCO family protein n=1 Tax=Hyphococcus sp. TaxID=2038636 RepID=UPI003CCB97B3
MRRFYICLAAVIAASGCSGEDPAAQIPTEGVVALSEQFTGEFDLIDKDGRAVRDEDFEGKVMLVYFGFTNCPDVCPGDINVMSAALNELQEQSSEVAPIFISVDPERDTPEALGDYFAFDERLHPLTGDVSAVKAARDAFKVYAQKQPLPDSALEYTVDHTRYFIITDRAGQPQFAALGGVTPLELAALLRRNIEG